MDLRLTRSAAYLGGPVRTALTAFAKRPLLLFQAAFDHGNNHVIEAGPILRGDFIYLFDK